MINRKSGNSGNGGNVGAHHYKIKSNMSKKIQKNYRIIHHNDFLD
jgi:hypothetical protein